eukprot:2868488-Rhodomonas_salina.1
MEEFTGFADTTNAWVHGRSSSLLPELLFCSSALYCTVWGDSETGLYGMERLRDMERLGTGLYGMERLGERDAKKSCAKKPVRGPKSVKIIRVFNPTPTATRTRRCDLPRKTGCVYRRAGYYDSSVSCEHTTPYSWIHT